MILLLNSYLGSHFYYILPIKICQEAISFVQDILGSQGHFQYKSIFYTTFVHFIRRPRFVRTVEISCFKENYAMPDSVTLRNN